MLYEQMVYPDTSISAESTSAAIGCYNISWLMDIQCTELNLGINSQRIMISTRISKLGMPHSNEINRVRSLVAKVTAQPAHGTEQTPGKVLAYYSRQRAARRELE